MQADLSHRTDQARLEPLLQRVEKLERENRRFRALLLAATVILAGLMVMGLTLGDPIIGAEAFTLVDQGGSLRGMLAMVQNEPTLALFDNEGRMRVGLSVVSDAPQLVLYDAEGNALWTAP